MNGQNKMSTKQVMKGQWKLVLFILIWLFATPVIVEAIFLTDLSQFNDLTILAKLSALLGMGDFTFTSTIWLSYLAQLLVIIGILLIPSIIAAKLDGKRIVVGLKTSIKNLTSKRYWKFIGKVYVPFFLLLFIGRLIIAFISEDVMMSVLSAMISSMGVTFLVNILLLIISAIISSIFGLMFIANVAYLRTDKRIKSVFELIPSREKNKIIIFNFIEITIFLIGLNILIQYSLSLEAMTLITNIVSILIGGMVALMIYQIIFAYIRVVLYINASSKIPLISNRVNSVKTITVNDSLEMSSNATVTDQTSIDSDKLLINNKEVEVNSSSSDNNPFES